MSRHWHVEHRDGRRWTWDEIHDLILPIGLYGMPAHSLAIDAHDYLILTDETLGAWCYADEATDDMKLAWDE